MTNLSSSQKIIIAFLIATPVVSFAQFQRLVIPPVFVGGVFGRLFFFNAPGKVSISSPQKQKPKPVEEKKINPVSHSKEISRAELKTSLKNNLQIAKINQKKLEEAIKEADARAEELGKLGRLVSDFKLPELLRNFKKDVDRQVSSLESLIKEFDKLNQEEIKKRLEPVRSGLFSMIIRKGEDKIRDKRGASVDSPMDGSMMAVRREMRLLVDNGWAKDEDAEALEGKIRDIDESRNDLVERINSLSDLMHSKSKITP